ncbi:sensor histidine kinase [Microbacterium sp. gxy059]|uniref:sensor histidine kinase n=1 Tax=Microbacterium sp. gxy059 TaxID=2957199 RepID=UPI003D98395F
MSAPPTQAPGRAAPLSDPHALEREGPAPAQLRSDLWLAAAIFVGGSISVVLSDLARIYDGEHAGVGRGLLYVAGLAAALAFRRRFVIVSAVVANLIVVIGTEAMVPEIYTGQIAMFMSVYTIGAWVANRQRATLARLGIIVGLLVWLFISTMRAAAETPPEELEGVAGAMSPLVAGFFIQWLVNLVFYTGAFVMGNRAYDAAIDRQALAERTRELEEQQELASAQAVALDRVRIARELHDVVAHHVSAMGVQAGAARAVIDADPEASKRALSAVEGSAREAIDELHRLLDTLRGGEDESEAPSTVGLGSLDRLVRAMDAAGIPSTLRVVGDPVAVPEFAQVNLFRIAQEAMTNARRHGGPDITVDVRLRYGADAVELEVTNTGRVVAGSRPGLGTLGMRERATSMGGRLEARPREDGGYLVRVSVPLG